VFASSPVDLFHGGMRQTNFPWRRPRELLAARTIRSRHIHLPEASCTKFKLKHHDHVHGGLTALVFQNTGTSEITSIVPKLEQPIPLTESWRFPEEDQEYDITLSQDWGDEVEFMGEGELALQFP
jgi:hypothetical protein